jgi:pyrroline-5-carboxylate reductase
MNILLIGCGNMGSAMLLAWLERHLLTRAVVVDHAVQELRHRFGEQAYALDLYPTVDALPPDIDPDLVVLAVKPQSMTEVLGELVPRMKPEWPVLTIAAGLRRSYYTRYLPANPIIRAMPNTPALVGKGMTVAVRDEKCSSKLQQQIEKLLAAVGDFFWLDNEDQIDAAMAVGVGSGPAYFFYLAEQLARAGMTHGLSEADAMRMVRQTLIGAGALVEAQVKTSLPQLRRNVTSPGGVTEATVKVWNDGNAFYHLIKAGVDANVQRSHELAMHHDED